MTQIELITLIHLYASIFGLEPRLAEAIARVESNLNPAAIGQIGEIGLFQIRPEYAGVSKKSLLNPNVNTLIAMRKLVNKRKECSHKLDNTWIICYNVGVEGAKRIKHPKLFPYYKKVMKEYSKL